MAEFAVSIDVEAPPEEVFCYLADLEHLPEWDSSVRTASLVSDTGPAVGRRYDITIGFYGRELDAEYCITRYERAEVVEWSIRGRADGITQISVQPSATGTRIDYRTALKMRGLARLLDKGLNAALEGIGQNISTALAETFRG